MILLDLPYVSDFLKQTITRNNFPVFEPSGPKYFQPGKDIFCLTEEEVIDHFRNNPDLRLYSNSENAIHWISKHLEFTGLPGIINQFKDKAAFRRMTQYMFPEIFFREVEFENLQDLDIRNFPFPFVIKPSIGFFSLGVYTVNNQAEWEPVRNLINEDICKIRTLYPTEVLDTSMFLVEKYIEGVEYAFDAYFDASGQPVILNILKHLFASGDDVSDRVYVTSKSIIRENLARLTEFLKRIGDPVQLKNFPLHVEVRIDSQGQLVPIEVNPLRFGGWCTTADITWFAYGINSYEYFLEGKKPDWNKIMENRNDNIFSLIVLNNSTGIAGKEIQSFDYDRLLTHFKKPLEIRKTNPAEFPLFGFLFTETREEEQDELDWILKNNLVEFIRF
jgi:hypothetical protein